MAAKILITGATGFVGSNLLRRLIGTENTEVHILSRHDSNMWRIADVLEKIKNHTVDLLEKYKLDEKIYDIQPDYVFHLANAGLYSGVSVSDEDLAKVNLLGLINLISALENVNYKGFINFGSSSEYGLKNAPMKETDRCEPANTYGVTKLSATLYASLAVRIKNKPIATFRLFSPFGPYDDYRRLISWTILDLLSNRSPSLAYPKAVRDYIFIDDVIDLFLEVLDKIADVKGEVFNVGRGREAEISKVVDLIAQFTNPEIKIQWGSDSPRPWESKKWEADMSKTFRTFKWRPKHSLESGIQKTIAWFKNNKNLYDQFLVSRS